MTDRLQESCKSMASSQPGGGGGVRSSRGWRLTEVTDRHADRQPGSDTPDLSCNLLSRASGSFVDIVYSSRLSRSRENKGETLTHLQGTDTPCFEFELPYKKSMLLYTTIRGRSSCRKVRCIVCCIAPKSPPPNVS